MPVAQGLAAHSATGALRLDRDDIRWLLDNARAYIVEDVGPGQRSVFRPFHDLLAAHLRGEPSSEQAAADSSAGQAWRQRRQQVERDITQVLLDSVPAFSDDTPDWELAHPYLCTYLAQHAYAAGPDTFAGLVADMDYLAVADPAILTPILTPIDPALRWVARPYRRARPLLGHSARDNSAYLQEASRALTGVAAIRERTGMRPLYRTHLAWVRRDDSLLTLTGQLEEVRSLAFGTTADRRLLLASTDGRTVRLWDPVAGTPAAEPLTGQTACVNSVAFGTTADGRLLLASACFDGTVRLWDPVTGTLAAEPLTGFAGGVSCSVAFGTTADGRLLLAFDDGETVRLWDPATGAPAAEPLAGHTDKVNSLAFGTTADGRLLLASAGGGDRTVRLWDPVTGTPAAEPFTGHTGWVSSVAFGTTADGRLLLASASIGDRIVRLWDPVTGTPAGKAAADHTGSVSLLAFGNTADGRLLLASASASIDDRIVRLWDPVTGAPAAEPLTGHTDMVNSLAFGTTADGRLLLASGGHDRTVRLWDPATGTPTAEPVTGPTKGVSSLAFGTTAGGRLLLASAGIDDRRDDRTVRLWDPATGTSAAEPLTGPPSGVPRLAYGEPSLAFGNTADGRLLLASAGSIDGTVRLWDPATGTLAAEITHSSVNSLAFGTTADGRLLLASAGSETVWVLDPVTGTPAGMPLTGHTNGVNSVAFGTTADGRLLLASAGFGGPVRLWDPVSSTSAGKALTHPIGTGTSLAFGTTADGRLLLASANGGTVGLWDPVTGTPAGKALSHPVGKVNSLAFGTTADGQLLLVSGGQDRTVRLWDPASWDCVAKIRRRSEVKSIAMIGPLLAIGDDEGICVIELRV